MPSWRELRRFCEADGWTLYRETDHYYYRKVLSDGTILRTKVSKGSGEIHGHLWDEIRKRQLKVSQEYFNGKL
jgi:hypothetical protein